MTTPWKLNNILAATDLDDSSLPALRYARLFADTFGAKLTVVYSDPLIIPVDTLGPSNAMFLMPSPEHDDRLRAEIAEYVAPVLAGRPYDIQLTLGQAAPAILETAAERKADLIVTGTHLREGWKRFLFGSVSDGVQHASSCPVLTVSAEHGPDLRISNVLCPINFTDVARGALVVAARVAEAFGARLFVVHVIEPGEVRDAIDDSALVRDWIGNELARSTTYRDIVLRGGAAERVLDCAEDVGANLVVIGAEHKLLHNATVIGATTERIMHFAPCPVLVVPRFRRSAHEDQRKRSARNDRRGDAGLPRTV